ncbi:MAG: VOC family protein [Thiobacillus sp.]|nr:VOC family protein [Thiobacillus sp.]
MPKLTYVRSVLAVKDLLVSMAFYCEKLGFTIDFEVDGWCFLSRDGIQLMLGHCPEEVPASQINDHSYFAYIGVHGIDELHEEFRTRGLTSLSAPESKPWGMREFMVTTPDGHRIMFGQDLESRQ